VATKLALTVVIPALTYRWIEHPFLKLSSRLRPARADDGPPPSDDVHRLSRPRAPEALSESPGKMTDGPVAKPSEVVPRL
jgi:peptidoglycan/LPS O-acetylase OafA/YrhL